MGVGFQPEGLAVRVLLTATVPLTPTEPVVVNDPDAIAAVAGDVALLSVYPVRFAVTVTEIFDPRSAAVST